MGYAKNYTIDELLISRMAKEVKGDTLAGGGTFTSHVAVMLAKRLYSPEIITLVGMNLIDVECVTPFTTWEFITHYAAYEDGNFGLHLSMDELFTIVMRGEWLVIVTPAQLDKFGNSNISVIGDWRKPKVQLIGPRGVPDDSVSVHKMYYFIPNHNPRSLVNKVDFICGVGYGEARERGEVKYGAPELVITNLGVFDFAEDTHRMRIKSLHPRVSLDNVVANTGFELIIPQNIEETEPPTEEEVRLIREEIDPWGVRRLDFVSGGEKFEVVKEIIGKEMEYLRRKI
jgi:glutaconate CoA-transferase subunit B